MMVSKQLAALTKRGTMLDADFANFSFKKEKKKRRQQQVSKKPKKLKEDISVDALPHKKAPVLAK